MSPFQVRASIHAKARLVLSDLGNSISESDTERSIAERAVGLLLREDLAETWYHRCPALVLLGSRSALSISGRRYEPASEPASEPVGDTNLVSVDLSPCVGEFWGDCARSFPVEEGKPTLHPRSPELREGLEIEQRLHDFLLATTTPNTRFCDLHAAVNEVLSSLGWENLDFGSHFFGHSIARHLGDRIYIDPTNAQQLGDVECFTFEPHVRRRGRTWSFKHEEIYYFDDNGQVHSL